MWSFWLETGHLFSHDKLCLPTPYAPSCALTTTKFIRFRRDWRVSWDRLVLNKEKVGHTSLGSKVCHSLKKGKRKISKTRWWDQKKVWKHTSRESLKGSLYIEKKRPNFRREKVLGTIFFCHAIQPNRSDNSSCLHWRGAEEGVTVIQPAHNSQQPACQRLPGRTPAILLTGQELSWDALDGR